MRVEPAEHFVNWQQDPQSNYVARLTFPDRVRELRIEVDLVAEMRSTTRSTSSSSRTPSSSRSPTTTWQLHELQPFLHTEPPTPRLRRLPRRDPRGRAQRTIDFLVELNQQLSATSATSSGSSPACRRTEETLELGSGSCRDSTWLLVQLLRHLGLAARFVSGYLIQLVPDVEAARRPGGPEARLHRSARVVRGLSARRRLDRPRSRRRDCSPAKGTFRSRARRSPASAAPVTGGVDECEVEFAHTMSVQRIYESPRVTKPYTDDAVAGDRRARPARRRRAASTRRAADDGRRADVRVGRRPRRRRVEHGGARSDQAPARGRPALAAAEPLSRRPAFVHFGQGKWYPGEQLPRWALGCYWRNDGEPAWQRRVALRRRAARTTASARPTPSASCARWPRASACRTRYVHAGYEDVWYYLWRERRLPVNVDPFDARLDDELERERLRRVFTQGSTPSSATRCRSCAAASRTTDVAHRPVVLRDERLYLMPGDSPMGYRLPLDSLPWVDRRRLPVPARARSDGAAAAAAAAGRDDAPSVAAADARGAAVGRIRHRRAAQRGESPRAWVVRTALCAEVAQRRALRLPAAGRRARATISSWSPRSKRRRPSSRHAACCSKAIRRRDDPRLRAVSRSRPIPA